MILLCDPCRRGDHIECKHYIRHFLDPDGPKDSACECYCNQARRRKHTADFKVKEIVEAYLKRYGQEELEKIIRPYLPKVSNEPVSKT